MKENKVLDTYKNNPISEIINALCGVAAIVFGVLNFFGFMHLIKDITSQIIVSSIGILLISHFTLTKLIMTRKKEILPVNDAIENHAEEIADHPSKLRKKMV